MLGSGTPATASSASAATEAADEAGGFHPHRPLAAPERAAARRLGATGVNPVGSSASLMYAVVPGGAASE